MQGSKLIGCICMTQSACAKSFNSLNIISYVNNPSACAIQSFMTELYIYIQKSI